MTNTKAYIHEFIHINGLNRAKCVHHMTANWSPTAQIERGQKCFGVWPVIGSTGRWPEVVNMWELEGLDGIARGMALEGAGNGAYDPVLEKWWARAAEFRRGGLDRIVIPAPWTRTIDQLIADAVSGVCYAHELVQVRPGATADLLGALHDSGIDAYTTLGWEPVGAYRVAMANDDECVLIWAIPTWEHWVAGEHSHLAGDTAIIEWRRSVAPVVARWQRILMVDAPLSPMRTGRQPHVDDRTDWVD